MNIFFNRIILYLLFYISFKSLIKCDECSDISDCYNCVLCSDETKSCPCVWTVSNCQYSSYGSYTSSDNWYSRISICGIIEEMLNNENVYCPNSSSFTTQDNLDSDNSITYTLKPDSQGYYGKKMVVCNFEYEQSTEDDININVGFSSGINKLPRVYIESTDITNIKTKVSVDSSRDIAFTKSIKVSIKVLLKNQYETNPLTIKLSLKSSKYAKIISIVITILFIGIMIGCVIFCAYRMYKNNEARREARMYLYRTARENMARIEQENNNYYSNNGSYSQEDSVDLEKINKEKLDKLFNGKMAQHLYKKEYNEYGGGCSICLGEFKKKSKVSITSCKHVFHYKCIHDWLYKNIRNPKCPNCNNEILNDEENNNNKENQTKIIKVKRKSGQMNNNMNQQNTADRGIAINNGSNIDASQSQRPQLGEY